jgi:hypothetical protein
MDIFVKGLECHIYKLTNSVDNTIYIGSTATSLQERFAYHSGELEYDVSGPRSSKLYKHLDRIGWKNVSITSIEKVVCYSRKQLLIHETKHIMNYYGSKLCLNTNLPFIYPVYKITTSMFKNSSTLYLATIANNYIPMKQVFKELITVCLPLHLGYKTNYLTHIMFYKVMLQLRSQITQFPEVKFKKVTQDLINSLAKNKIKKDSHVPTMLPVINQVGSTLPPKKRGRPKKVVPIHETQPPQEVPIPVSIAVPMSPVHAKQRGRPKKTSAQSNLDAFVS